MLARTMWAVCLLVAAAVWMQGLPSSSPIAASEGMSSVSPQEWRWEPIPNMKPGAERVVLRKDAASGATELLARYPSGYVVPWHWHTANERLVVLEGRFRIESSEHQVELGQGGFVFQPGRNVHQVSCVSGPCMYYAHWDGPWDINYVEPEEPR